MLRMYVLHAWRNGSCSKHDNAFKRVCIPKFMDGMPTFFLSFLPLFLSLSFFHFLLYLLKLSLGYTHTLTHIFIYSHMRDGTKKGDEKLANRNYASHMGEDRGVRTSRECVRSIGTGGKSSLCFLKPQCFLLNVPLIICIQDAQPYTD